MKDELIIKYFIREASDKELALLVTWLEESEANRKHFASMETLWNLSHPACNIEDIQVGEALGKVESLIGFIDRPVREPVWRRVSRYVELAAACLVLPLLLFSAYFIYKDKSVPAQEAGMIQVSTLSGMTGQVTLPDGTQVWLNSGSTLFYPAVFQDSVREVRLDGEGYFKVQKDGVREFCVHCPHQNIRVLGTEFDVEAYSDNPCAVTSLLEGSIVLRSESGSEVTMMPGQVARVNGGGSIDISPIADLAAGSWREDLLSFSGTRLSDVLRLVGNRYGVRFVLRNENLNNHLVKGDISGQRLETVLSNLSYISGIRFVRSEASSSGREVIEVY